MLLSVGIVYWIFQVSATGLPVLYRRSSRTEGTSDLSVLYRRSSGLVRQVLQLIPEFFRCSTSDLPVQDPRSSGTIQRSKDGSSSPVLVRYRTIGHPSTVRYVQQMYQLLLGQFIRHLLPNLFIENTRSCSVAGTTSKLAVL
jgi:hypothetical protein